MLAAIVNSAVDAIIIINEQGFIESANPACEKLFGYKPEELVGRNIAVIMPFPYRGEHDRYLKSYLRTGNKKIIGIGREVEALRQDGTTCPVDLAVSEVQFGKKRFFTGILRDLTTTKASTKALQESQARFKAFMDNSPTVAFMKDQEWRYVYANKQFERVFQIDPEGWLMKTDLDFWPEEIARRLRENDEQVLSSGRVCEFQETVPTPDGAPHDWLVFKFPWQDPSGRKFLGGVAIDITERSRMQKALVEQASLARLGELAAVVAHEVKNPLAGIAGALRIIHGRLPQECSDRAIMEEILIRIDSLTKSVSDILVYARPRKPILQSLPIRFLLEDCFALLSEDPLFASVEVRLTGADLTVPGDAELLKPVFVNFLVNSAQAMKGKGRIAVHVQTENGCCQISLADTGPGIPAELQEKIFEPFFTTKPQGTGLGLTIARRIIELHGGNIAIQCPPEGGTTILVQLPLGSANPT
ncbi:MAG: PAS domain S-box protein [Planctomycetes bacterium]|nr:PAS domain S-box protein [Planctomycetota bacterium]